MQDNTESEKSGNFSDNEEPIPEVAETAPSEIPDLTESGPGFEEQKMEFLSPEEKKKSGAGKVFLLLILVLGGSGSYLYFNNLIPPKILNLVYPKSPPSKPLALITETLPFMDEVGEIPLPTETVETRVVEPTEPPESHISGNVAEPKPPTHISGSDFDQTFIEENFSETTSLEEAQSEKQVEEEPRELENLEEAESIVVHEVTEEVESIREPVTELVAETILPPEPALLEPQVPQRSKTAQAYLDFIESSVLKIGKLIGEGFNWGWNYLKRLLRLSAEQGLAEAQYNLGFKYQYGQGVPQDYKEAIRLFRLAACMSSKESGQRVDFS